MLEKKLRDLKETGVTGVQAAEYLMKQAGGAQEFLEALALLVDQWTEEKPVEEILLPLSHVQLTFHRHFKKHFGDSAASTALVLAGNKCPVALAQINDKGRYYLKRRREPKMLDPHQELRREVQKMLDEGASDREVKLHIRAFKLERELPLGPKHYLEGETEEELRKQGFVLEVDQITE